MLETREQQLSLVGRNMIPFLAVIVVQSRTLAEVGEGSSHLSSSFLDSGSRFCTGMLLARDITAMMTLNLVTEYFCEKIP
jgi:hypothetical protein